MIIFKIKSYIVNRKVKEEEEYIKEQGKNICAFR